nr:MAG TPA: hypothetical protein [Caudoviricetes sp.]
MECRLTTLGIFLFQVSLFPTWQGWLSHFRESHPCLNIWGCI